MLSVEVAITNIGLLGCGNIGTTIIQAVKEGRLDVKIGALYDVDYDSARRLAEQLGRPDLCKKSFDSFISADMDLVIEAASVKAVRDHAERIVASGRSLIVLSVGGLIDPNFRGKLVDASKASGSKIIVPSGAIGGLDLLKAGRVAGIDEVILTTTKNPKSLPEGDSITQRTVVFEGNVEEAVRLFPKNINVAAAVSIASGVNPRVRIVADPAAGTNTHEVEARGAFGNMRLIVSNVPSPGNPKTSYLAALSVIRTIQGFGESLVVGT